MSLQYPISELALQQTLLLLQLLKDPLVLMSSPGKVGEHLVDGSVRNVLVHAEARLAQWEGEVVAHAQKLSKADHLVLRFDVVLLHLLQGEPHRVLVVGSHHRPHPLPFWFQPACTERFSSCTL